MNIQLQDENKRLSLTNDENNNDNYLTLTLTDGDNDKYFSLDVEILELYSAVLSFITLKKKNEENEEHYAKTELLRNYK